jgi:hypothetical protein
MLRKLPKGQDKKKKRLKVGDKIQKNHTATLVVNSLSTRNARREKKGNTMNCQIKGLTSN